MTGSPTGESAGRRVRADARRNIDALLEAATTVFATSGVDAPVREIAARAGVGMRPPWPPSTRPARHCGGGCSATPGSSRPSRASPPPCTPGTPLRGPARLLRPAVPAGARALPASAAAAGEVRADVDVDDLLRAVANLCLTSDAARAGHSRRMVALLIDGLRYGAGTPAPTVVGTAPDHG